MSGPIGGTYDFLYLPFLLPAPDVEALLPDGARLLPVPDSTLARLFGDDRSVAAASSSNHASDSATHLVALQLGFQKNTGPLLMPFGLTFSEAKLEIPFVSHPYLTKPDTDLASAPPFLLKQTILFSSPLLSVPSNLMAGLKSHHVSFAPHAGMPFHVPADSGDAINYTAQGFIDASFQPTSAATQPELEADPATLRALTSLLHADWFGHRTGKTINRFEYARLAPSLEPTAIQKDAEIAPRLYAVAQCAVDLAAFAPSKTASAPLSTVQVPKGTKAWRVRAQYRSFVRSV